MNISDFPAVSDVRRFSSVGPWKSKSGGLLTVPLKIDYSDLLGDFLSYDSKSLADIPEDIRGLRIYTVRKIPKGACGGGEFHKIRKEIAIVLKGKFRWKCEDLRGEISKWVIAQGGGIWMPPYIMHSYTSLENDGELLVVANTLFDPQDPKTYDTYSADEFSKLKS